MNLSILLPPTDVFNERIFCVCYQITLEKIYFEIHNN